MKNFTKNKFGQVVVLSVASIGVASAAVDAAVTTAITTAGTDAASVGSAVLVVLVGIKAFKYIRHAL